MSTSESHRPVDITILTPDLCYSQSIVVALTAYSISSEYLSGGTCMTASGTVITLTPPISANAVKPASIAESDFQQILADDFASNLGFLSCLKHEQNYLPTPLAPVSNITATVASGIPISLNSTSLQPFATSTITSSRPSRSSHFGLTVPQQAGTGVGVSLGSILLLLLGWLLLRKRRRQKPISKGVNEPKQPYLQSKAELDDHENRIRVYELEAQRSPIPELEEGDSQDHELEGPVSSPELSDRVPVRRRQELEGQDGSSELNGHEGIIDGVRRASSGG